METRRSNVYLIESVGHCPSGVAPRWTWWLRGVDEAGRYGIVGTDEEGRGLYIFRHAGDRAPEREQLAGPGDFSIPGGCSTQEASSMMAQLLETIGWGSLAPARTRPTGA
ncbi:hypothetical protein [Uliginosibacterium sp. H1]|uniref:hypothetical protein n=1 Tax=Uliginosibacterium sp. H1 TaxID=3114757 RepID=UPI002E1709DE|nr:hypothetical protein [Uliginosibacterium sp. H1]